VLTPSEAELRARDIHACVEELLGEPVSRGSVKAYLRVGCSRKKPLFEYFGERGYRLAKPIAVVIAAWDEAAQLNLAPPAWLNWRTPLLDQRLRANEEEVPFKVFGVSAQGGNLHDEAVRQILASHIEDRPLPKNGSPLTAPLKWLLEHNRD
jgi:hypothetical protein